jgi:hypothetical protein
MIARFPIARIQCCGAKIGVIRLGGRPVAAATALDFKPIEFISPLTRFEILFSSDRLGPGLKLFLMYQHPRNAMACCLRFATVVPPKTIVDILAGAGLPSPHFSTAKHVNVIQIEVTRHQLNFSPFSALK